MKSYELDGNMTVFFKIKDVRKYLQSLDLDELQQYNGSQVYLYDTVKCVVLQCRQIYLDSLNRVHFTNPSVCKRKSIPLINS